MTPYPIIYPRYRGSWPRKRITLRPRGPDEFVDDAVQPRRGEATLTLNTKDFADFAEHEGIILIGGDEP